MANTVRVSVIIPVYNMKKYLARCLDSLIQQTMPDFEALIIDDGSSDASAEIAKKYLSDERFSYTYQSNSGVSAARNNGLARSSGEWTAFIDPDDYLEADCFEKLLNACDEKTDIVSCCCKAEIADGWETIHFFDGDRVFSGGDASSSGYLSGKRELLLELLDVDYNSPVIRKTAIGVPWGKLYRTDFLQRNGLEFNRELFRFQDNIFNMYAFDAAEEIKYIDLPLYDYNLDNITDYNRKFSPKAKAYFDIILQLRNDFLSRNGLLADKEIYFYYCGEVLRNSDVMLRQYFLHRENKNTLRVRINEMREKFMQKQYAEVFDDRETVNRFLRTRPLIQKIRLRLLLGGKYRMLIAFDSAVQTLRRVRG